MVRDPARQMIGGIRLPVRKLTSNLVKDFSTKLGDCDLDKITIS